MKQKILLVDPPYQLFAGYYRFYFPGGLASIAAKLRQDGHEVLIADLEHKTDNTSKTFIDNNESHEKILEGLAEHPVWENYKELLKNFNPSLVGITAVTPKIASVLKVAAITKEVNAGAYVVVGGNHPTARPQDLLKDKNIDLAVVGEGEMAMSKLAGIQTAGNRLKVLGNIIHENPVGNLDSLPFPARETLMELSSYRPIDMGMISTSRGCQYSCTFCDVPVQWGSKVRFRSVDNVLEEMEHVQRDFGTEYFSFRDSTFTFDRERTISLAQKIKERLDGVSWECLTKPNYIDAELIEILQGAGCHKIRVGVESGSGEMVKYMKKGATLDDVRKTSKMLNDSGIDWSAYFMLGTPQETAGSMDETYQFMKEINPPFISLTKYTPMPGSAMFDEVVKAGLLDPDSTDWTWALNQSLQQVFVTKIDPDVFRKKMSEIAEYVKEHNSSKGLRDERIKP